MSSPLHPSSDLLIPQPALSYADALKNIAALQAEERRYLDPRCLSQLFTYGYKTQQAIVLVHGYTNSPCQFHQLGEQLYQRGYNVFIPLLPYHGRLNRLTTDQSRLTAESLVRYINRAIDLARGLGHQITLTGLSGGGTAVAWAAQYRKDVDRAVLIAPIFGFRPIPALLTRLADWVFLILPDFYRWWDPVRKAGEGGINHAYPRYSTHAMAQILRLGLAVRQAAYTQPPVAGSIAVVTNANDPIPNQRLIDDVVAHWRSWGVTVQTYEFAAELNLLHDLIDPDQPQQHVDQVYPKLVQLITQCSS